MLRRAHILALSGAALLSLAPAGAQPAAPKTLTSYVIVQTKERMAAVLGKADANGPGQFLFCMDLLQPGQSKTEFSGRARVVYVPQPIQGLPPGVTISGPEPVRSVLAVVPESGKTLLYVGRGEKVPLPAGDPALKNAVSFPVSVVRRIDWTAAAGPRRGTELSDCFVDAG
jgi:hypothetical protein